MKWLKLHKRTTTAKKLTNDNESSSNEIFIRRSNIYYALIITGTMAWHGHFFVNFSNIHTYDCEPCMCVQSDCKFHLIRNGVFSISFARRTLRATVTEASGSPYKNPFLWHSCSLYRYNTFSRVFFVRSMFLILLLMILITAVWVGSCIY